MHLSAVWQACGLLQSGNDDLTKAGLCAGLLGAGAYGVLCVQRLDKTPSKPLDWPGAKVSSTTQARRSRFQITRNKPRATLVGVAWRHGLHRGACNSRQR